MIKLFENKTVFYISTLLAIVFSILILMTPLGEAALLLASTQVLIILCLVFLMIFFSKAHKELSKVMLTSILVAVIYRHLVTIYISVFVMSVEVFELSKLNQIFSPDNLSTLLPTVTTCLSLFLVLIIYIDHCIINFSNKPSEFALILNHTIVIVYVIGLIGVTISNASKPQTVSSSLLFFSNLDNFFTVIAVVCTETYINKKRVIRENDAKIV